MTLVDTDTTTRVAAAPQLHCYRQHYFNQPRKFYWVSREYDPPSREYWLRKKSHAGATPTLMYWNCTLAGAQRLFLRALDFL